MQTKNDKNKSLTEVIKNDDGSDSCHHFDVTELNVQFCPAAEAEHIAKRAVLRDLRLRAKLVGKKIRGGSGDIVGPQRCRDVQWLWITLGQMRREFAAELEQDLEKLKRSRANQEALVGHIYTLILCIRATHTIFFGDDQ